MAETTAAPTPPIAPTSIPDVGIKPGPAVPVVLMNPLPAVKPPMEQWKVTVLLALIGTIQVISVAYIGRDIGQRVDGTTEQVIKMERQINSNMERQITQAIDEAIARERLRVNLGESVGNADSAKRTATDKKAAKDSARGIVDGLKCVDGKSPVTGAPCRPNGNPE